MPTPKPESENRLSTRVAYTPLHSGRKIEGGTSLSTPSREGSARTPFSRESSASKEFKAFSETPPSAVWISYRRKALSAEALIRGEAGIPAVQLQAAYESAFQNSLLQQTEERVSWEPFVKIFAQGAAVRREIQRVGVLDETDIESALLCLRHLWDVQLSLSIVLGRPQKEERALVQKAVLELNQLQARLKDRELSFNSNAKTSLQLALTHLMLGAVSLNVHALKEKLPELYYKESSEMESMAHIPFKNPIHRVRSLLPAKSGLSQTSLNDHSVLEQLSQAATDFLKSQGASTVWMHALHRNPRWMEEALNILRRKKGQDDSMPLFEFLIRHTEQLRKTRLEPIEISLVRVMLYAITGAGIAAFMQYKAPSPFAADSIRVVDEGLGFFAPPRSSDEPLVLTNDSLVATATFTVSISPNGSLVLSITPSTSNSLMPSPSATSTNSRTRTQSQTVMITESFSPSATFSVSLSRSLSGSFSLSITPSSSLAPTPTQSGTRSLTGTGSPTLLLTPTPSAPNCNSSNFWVKTLGGSGDDNSYGLTIASDGSLFLTGYTTSFGAGANDVLLTKLYSNGSLTWAKTLGGANFEIVNSLAIAPDGSLFLTGYTNSFGAGNFDILLAKFYSNASLAWAQTLGGTTDDYGYSLTIASDGSLFLTGYTSNFGAGNGDVLLAKLESNGSLSWAKTLGGTNADFGISLMIAPEGSLFLTGQTNSFGAGLYDVLLAKFEQNGSLSWVKTLGGINTDISNSLTIAPDGSLFLTGGTYSFGLGNEDVFLAKFEQNGSLIWAKTLGGTAVERGNSLTIAPDDSLLLTGYTSSFGAGNFDMLLAKFYSNDSLAWVKALGGANADYGYSLTIAQEGSLFLTGLTSSFGAGSNDVLLAKFTSEGDLPFSNNLIRLISNVSVQSINPTVMDITNNMTLASWPVVPQDWTSVIVSNINPIMMDLNCVPASVTPTPTQTLSITPSGSMIIPTPTPSLTNSGTGTKSPTLSITPSPSLLCDQNIENFWLKTLGGSNTQGNNVIISADDHYLFAGKTNSFGAGGTDALLAKFNVSGGLVWARTLGGGVSDYANSLSITSNGELILIGRTASFGGSSTNVLLAKFQANGSLNWAKTFGGTITNEGHSIAVDSNDNLLLTGNTYNSVSTYFDDVFLVKIKPDGNLDWAKTLPILGSDVGKKLLITSDNSIILIGAIRGFGAGGTDVLLAKFQADGNLAWAKTLGGISNDEGYDLDIDSDNNILLIGKTNSFGAGSDDVLLAKFAPNGNLMWARALGGSGVDQGFSLAIPRDDNLILTGVTTSFGAGNNDVLLGEIYSNGSLAWLKTLGGASNERGLSLAITLNRSLILTGYTQSIGTGTWNLLLAKLTPQGELSFGNSFIQAITTDQFQNINPTITDITSSISVTPWTANIQNWNSVIVSSIDPFIQDFTCFGTRRRLELTDTEQVPEKRATQPPRLFSTSPRPRPEYEPLNALPQNTARRSLKGSSYSVSELAAAGSGMAAVLCLLGLWMLCFCRRRNQAIPAQKNTSLFFVRKVAANESPLPLINPMSLAKE